ncbi:hypothetical protein CRG98_038825 [Punica granatum]|uniref:Retrotransposon gag domain-containing protein n=1 Tax=Punica granatum TaxID=22663 RepID=A0A2I0I9Y0_PUNGR|nr:hypothetical protein CRG98_038825 [Punica granatum]
MVTFGGGPDEDPNVHISNFLMICSTFNLNGVSDDVIRLRLFPFSLRDAAKEWLLSQPPESIATWDDLAAKFYPPSKIAKSRTEFIAFKQFESGNQPASLRSLEAQVGQMAQALNNRAQGSLPSNTEEWKNTGGSEKDNLTGASASQNPCHSTGSLEEGSTSGATAPNFSALALPENSGFRAITPPIRCQGIELTAHVMNQMKKEESPRKARIRTSLKPRRGFIHRCPLLSELKRKRMRSSSRGFSMCSRNCKSTFHCRGP